MSVTNGSYDQASIAQAVAALLFGEAIRIRCRDETERQRMTYRFRRYAGRLGFRAQIRTEEQFLVVRWNKAESSIE